MRHAAETLLVLLVIAVVAVGFHNVYSDNYAVTRMAEEAACAGRGTKCRIEGMLMIRSPVAQTFDYLINGRPVHVRCARTYLLVGDYACAAEGGCVPFASGAVPSSRAPVLSSGTP